MTHFPVNKAEGEELPVPNAWRPALKELADAMVSRRPFQSMEGFIFRDNGKEARLISYSNVDDYPDTLGLLTEKSWNSSIHLWQDGYWQVLVDLITDRGEVSDLVLHAKITEHGEAYAIELGLIYVP